MVDYQNRYIVHLFLGMALTYLLTCDVGIEA